jgi:hypothetical protein
MPTITTYADPDDLDLQTSLAVSRITRERAQMKILALSVLGAALLAWLGMTYAMYATVSAATPIFRLGTSISP